MPETSIHNPRSVNELVNSFFAGEGGEVLLTTQLSQQEITSFAYEYFLRDRSKSERFIQKLAENFIVSVIEDSQDGSLVWNNLRFSGQ